MKATRHQICGYSIQYSVGISTKYGVLKGGYIHGAQSTQYSPLKWLTNTEHLTNAVKPKGKFSYSRCRWIAVA